MDTRNNVCNRRQSAFYRQQYARIEGDGNDAYKTKLLSCDDTGGQVYFQGKEYYIQACLCAHYHRRYIYRGIIINLDEALKGKLEYK